MSGLNKRIRLFCAGMALGTLGLLALPYLRLASWAVFPGGTSSQSWWAGNSAALTAVVAALLGAVNLVCAVHLAGLFGPRLRRDLERLRESIRAITADAELPGGPFAFAEVGECLADLAEAHRTLSARWARLQEDATIDPLTGLANRRNLMYTLRRETAVAQRTGWPLSVVMIDLDYFKALNDRYGHQAGDLVLQRTARRFASLVRRSDLVARFGGEEFVVVLPSTALSQAVEIAEQLRAALRCDQVAFEGESLQITASFGVAELHTCGLHSAEALLSKADTFLYDAKRNGRDRVVAAPPNSAITSSEPERAAVLPAAGAPSPATDESGAPDKIDRDAMALLGSMFSILQVIPDAHRVVRDILEQVAVVLHASDVTYYRVSQPDGVLRPDAALDQKRVFHNGAGRRAAELQGWFDGLVAQARGGPDRCSEPQVVREAGGGICVRIPLLSGSAVWGVIEARDVSEHLFEPVDSGDDSGESGGEAGPSILPARRRVVLAALGTIGATALKTCADHAQTEVRWISLLEVLCRTLHSNDAYKRAHAEKVANLAFLTAKAMGQHNSEQLQFVRIAALLHDIGKVGVPAAIFQKRGRLRKRERELLQQHCRIGAEILQAVAHMTRLADIVHAHHEHYDGGGYPRGLAGAEIPIESRIIAVADAYDAMTSARSYRAALPHDQAIDRLRQAVGSQFDPDVVMAFLEHVADASRSTGEADAFDAGTSPGLAVSAVSTEQ